MEAIRIGLVGFGVVGSGTFKLLQRNAAEIKRHTGRDLIVTAIAVRDKSRVQPMVGERVLVTNDPLEVAVHPNVDIVVELMGGDTIARDVVLEAIGNGKHVVTANKALLAKYGNEIFSLANAKGVMVAYEAAVAGGIPIIKAIREGLTANRIEWIAGIINGTTNSILSDMRNKKVSYEEALAEAQRLGFAEADPTFDVEGVDAGHKITILAALAFGIPVQFSKAHIEGIRQLQQEDIRYAEEIGYRIKLLGIAKRTASGVELRVHPALVPAKSMLANVEGGMNAVLVKGDAIGPSMYYGAGAGSEPTASAVVADLIDVTRLHTADPEHRVPHLAMHRNVESEHLNIVSIDAVETRYYLRVEVKDTSGVLAEIARLLATHHVSIVSMIQKPSEDPKNATAKIIFVTHLSQEKAVRAAVEQIEKLPTVLSKVVQLRIENLDIA